MNHPINQPPSKQNYSIGKILPSLEKRHVEIYDAYQNKEFISKLTNPDLQEPLFAILETWSLLYGYAISPKELLVIGNAIINNFKTLTLKDIEYARDLAGQGLFKYQYQYKFTALFAQCVLVEYRSVRGSIISNVNAKLSRIENQKGLPVPTQKKRLETIKQVLQNAYDHEKNPKKENRYIDLGSVIFDFLEHNQLFSDDNRIRNDAENFARNQLLISAKKQTYKAVLQGGFIEKTDKDISNHKNLIRQYYVLNWLESFKNRLQFNTFVDNLTIENLP